MKRKQAGSSTTILVMLLLQLLSLVGPAIQLNAAPLAQADPICTRLDSLPVSTKQNCTDELVVIPSDGGSANRAESTLPSDSTLIAHYGMQKNVGTTLVDSSIYGNDGTLSGDTALVASHTGLGLALDLDGTGGYALVPDDPRFDFENEITLAVWVKPDAQATQSLVKKAVHDSIDGFELALASGSSPAGPGKAFVRFNQSSSGNTYRLNSLTQYPFDGNTWVHLAATYDGVSIRFYYNGVQEDSLHAGINIVRNKLPLGIGAQSDGTTLFDGQMDELRVYNRALTLPEIQALAGMPPGDTADLSIAKDDGEKTANPGDSTTFTIVVSNGGPDGVTGATVTDSFPPELTGVTWTCTATGGASCAASGSGDINDTVNLPSGSSTAYIVNAAFDAGATGDVSNTASVAPPAEVTDPYTHNNSATAVTSLGGAPPNIAPDQPVLVSPPDAATGVSTSSSLEVTVSDPDADPLTVTFYGRPAAPAPGSDFTLIALPDTQHYTDDPSNYANFSAQTQWVVDSRVALSIPFVTHLGDIVQNGNNNGDDTEWLVADAAMSLLEDPVTTLLADGIPFGLVPGNKDKGNGGSSSTESFNRFFGVSRFLGRGYYGGHFDPDLNDNNFELFSSGGYDFIIIHLEYDSSPSAAVLNWADNLLKTYSNRRAIAVTHSLIGTGNPGSFGSQGQAIYDALKDNPNLFLMLGGHRPGEGRREDTFNGNTVYSLLADYQGRSNGGNGWLRMMEFSPANNEIRVKTYSPVLDQFETDSSSQFTLIYDMQAVSFQPLGTNTNVPSGSNTSLTWPGLEGGAGYEWYVTVDDGTSVTTGTTWSFTTDDRVDIDHETGDLSQYDNTVTDFGDLRVTASAALSDTLYGLRLHLDDTLPIYGVKDLSPPGASRVRSRFYIDPNGLTMAPGDNFQTLIGIGADIWTTYAALRFDGASYSLRAAAKLDDGSWRGTAYYPITDAPHYVEIDWLAASGPGNDDGALTLWIDGVEQQALLNLDNDTRIVDRARFGAMSVDAGTSGTFFLDELTANNDGSMIGPGPPSPIVLNIDHETGDLAQYDSAVTDLGDLSITASAALSDTLYGLQLLLDDTNPIYGIKDLSTQAVTRFRSRFYIDPNGLTMAPGDSFQTLTGIGDGVWTTYAELSFDGASYSLRAAAKLDNGSWHPTAYYPITDGPHYVEIDWQASSGPGNDDGALTLWIDGVEQQALLNLDNDTRVVDYARFGAISVDATTGGTLFLDELTANNDGAMISPPPPSPIVLDIDHETGDLSQYDSTVTDLGDLSVTASAALSDTLYGLRVHLDDTVPIYGIKDLSTQDVTRFRSRFYIDPNSLMMASGDNFQTLIGIGADIWTTYAALRFDGASYALRATAKLDDGSWHGTAYHPITDGPHYVEIDWLAASGPGNDDGALTLWIDGVEREALLNLDNDTRVVDYAKFGAINVDAATSGTFFLDELTANNDGAMISPPPPSPIMLDIDHETGDLSQYDSTVTDGGDLSVTASAALSDTLFGLQLLLDDTLPIYGIKDLSEPDATRFRGRFYIDPNGLTMAPGDNFQTLIGIGDGAWTTYAELSFDGASYGLRAAAKLDNGSWQPTASRPITDGPHYVEIDWLAASGPGNDDGALTLWIDGVEQQTLLNLETDTRVVDYARFGAIGVDAGTSGTLLLDELTANNDGSMIGPVPPSPIMLDIDHETGDLSQYDSAVTDLGDLSVTASAALSDTLYGLRLLLDDTLPIYGIKHLSTQDATRFRSRFYIDPNGLTMAPGDNFQTLIGIGDGVWTTYAGLRFDGASYELRAAAKLDNGSWHPTAYHPITDGPHYVEIDWLAASGPGNDDGALTLWIDGVERESMSGLDNDTRVVDYARFGAISVDATTSGTLFLDELTANNDGSMIGPVPPSPIMLDIDHETGDLSQYDSTVTDLGDLSVTASAALSDTLFGLQLLLDDTLPIYGIKDLSEPDATRFRGRFYIDPSGLTMAPGDNFQTLVGVGNDVGTTYAALRFNGASYSLRAAAKLDNGNWHPTAFYAITDGPHYVEIDWQASSGPGNDDGALTLWIDGVEQEALSSLDTDTRVVDYAKFGAINVDAATSGTFFLDELTANNDGSMISPPPRSAIVLDIDHETADLSQYDSTVTDGGDLSVTASAALSDTLYGLQLLLDDTLPIYGIKDLSAQDFTRFRSRFYIDPNGLTMAPGDNFHTLIGVGNDVPTTYAALRFNGASYSLRAAAKLDNGNWHPTAFYAITDGPHYVEIDWQASSGPGNDDGALTLWIDGVEQEALSGLDNDTRVVDLARFGAIGVDTGTSGTFYLDELTANNDGSVFGP